MMYLCSKVADKEWSGILFYESVGDILDIENFLVIGKEIFLKDIGTATYTEFSYGVDEISFVMDKPGLETADWGKIHSHAVMNTFHSTTDMDDLWQNTETNNYYLSFIVNNRGDVEVKIGWRGKNILKQHNEYQIRNNNGEWVTKVEEVIKEEDVFIIANGDIIVEQDLPDNDFIARLEAVKTEITERAKIKTVTPPVQQYKQVFPQSPVGYQNNDPKEWEILRFLSRFISAGHVSNVKEAFKRVKSLSKKDFETWTKNIFLKKYWDTYFDAAFKNADEYTIALECADVVRNYEKDYPEISKILLEQFFDVMVGVEEQFEAYAFETPDVPMTKEDQIMLTELMGQ